MPLHDLSHHIAIPFASTHDGKPASYRCVRCKRQWSATVAPPAMCEKDDESDG